MFDLMMQARTSTLLVHTVLYARHLGAFAPSAERNHHIEEHAIRPELRFRTAGLGRQSLGSHRAVLLTRQGWGQGTAFGARTTA